MTRVKALQSKILQGINLMVFWDTTMNFLQIKSPKADAKDAENVKRLQGQLEAAQQEQVLLRGEVRRLQALSGVTHAPDTEVEDDTFASGAKALVKQLSTTFRTIWLILVIGLAIMDA